MEEFIRFSFVLVLLFVSCCCHGTNYSRELVQKDHPEFGNKYLLFLDENEQLTKGYIQTKQLARSGLDFLNIDNRVENAMTYKFYTRNIPNGKSVSTVDDLGSDFDNSKPTKFITHGFLSSGDADTCISIKNQYLNKSDVNVFILDWSPVSKIVLYDIPRRATKSVGEFLAKFINNLIEQAGLFPKDLHMTGHSLGAHVLGFAGRLLLEKPARITALDPALPGFDVSSTNLLTKNDADFVDIIHTCAGLLGISDPIGHADFYPNGGGPPQPGCNILSAVEGCSHGRSWKLFASSITSEEPFFSFSCQDYDQMERASCVGDMAPMGEPTPNSTRGIYYLKTAEEFPFVISLDDNTV